MARKKFLRRTWKRYSKLGKRRKKLQKWRAPKGRDNKMRESKKGKPPLVSIGYAKQKTDKKTMVVYNTNDLQNAGKNITIILGRVGKKKKIEIAKKAKEMGVKFQNINIKKILEK